ncbi:hypothetical protein A8H39_02035 [Paraburkholderia fungorum]|uniref:hypothetical protein n=1 Tax=Paraburkholderia fungorum TaxID=134537 RepID=UPI000481D390|nr:hypothetical protein [Paraburkholderia fungorum]MBB5546571.1 hypothetical protein [Paraburkholderia fungorum]PNE59950.1 hypothetical protein A8H39_02035 [Paraburkholderia fungorum]
MTTIWHCHFELDYLIRQRDEQLAEMLTGGTPVEIRTQLICMRAAGKRYLAVGKCDNRDREGKCAGHPN